MVNKLFAPLLCAVLLICTLTAVNAGAVYDNGLTYTEKNGALMLSSADVSVPSKLVIPETVGGLKVTEIDASVFASATKITSVRIPGSVKKVGKAAFRSCPMLEEVVFEESEANVSLGEDVFRGCTSLKHLVLPDKLKTIPVRAFDSCALTGITLPDGVVSIGTEAFINNTSLAFATIPDTVTAIGNHAFFGCTKLACFNITDGNTKYAAVDGNLFSKDKTLLIQYALGKTDTSYTVPSGVTEIGSGAFAFGHLVSVKLPEGLDTIGTMAFQDSAALSSVEFPSTLEEIGDSAFYHCYALKSVTIPASVTEYTSSFQYSGLESVTIEDGVTVIPNDAFTGCASLREVNIPDSVTEIASAFLDCASLGDIKIPASVKQISHDTFSGCPDLVIVTPTGSYAEQYAKDKNIRYREPEAEYTAEFISDGMVISSKKYQEGEAIAKPADPSKEGYIFKGWSPEVPAAMPAKDLTFTAVFEKTDNPDEVSNAVINAPSGTREINWKFRAHLVAKASLPTGYSVVWFEEGVSKPKSADYTTENLTSSKTFTAKIIDSSGNVVSKATQEKKITVTVKSDFFTKIISFFMRLFGNDTITI